MKEGKGEELKNPHLRGNKEVNKKIEKIQNNVKENEGKDYKEGGEARGIGETQRTKRGNMFEGEKKKKKVNDGEEKKAKTEMSKK